ncbi:thiamine biosynthesis lipoprotein [Persephonella hydrogeniphila]|uniref:FAD:protein FMN transferase n=1 Tax=Persephonella hydrogeniphila TaxID=198703 RepID=A0A285NBU9_9AQUI|nr:FAD:protein FMN transferase [Persephonella hydrogeniphila]SNZ06393.1 thiamine biosynthesis lipoprotein [Persephonella hydrogeniphila]
MTRIIFVLLTLFGIAFSIERTKYIMGVPVSISAEEIPEEAFDIFKKVDRYFSIYRNDSFTCKLNKEKKLEADSFFLELLLLSIDINKETDGYFDISLGNITYKYGEWIYSCDFRKTDTTGMENIRIDGNTVYLKNGVSLDFGGIAKGYAIDRASEIFRKNGLDSVIKASGDIRCLGKCSICVKNPVGEGVFLCFKTKMRETAVSTSGVYERFIGSTDNNHLINPKTGRSSGVLSITVFGSIDSASIDGYSTAVSVMPTKKTVEFLNSKKLGFFIIKKGCVIQGKYNSLYISDLTFFYQPVYCKDNENYDGKGEQEKENRE